MTRVLVGDRIVATIDTWKGTRVPEAVLHVDAVRLLTCGCQRLEADRPGGGRVAVLRGAHCEGTMPATCPDTCRVVDYAHCRCAHDEAAS